MARIADSGQASQTITFYFGPWFDLTAFGTSATSSTLTRHIYLGNQLIADSPVTGSLAPGSPAPVYFVHADHLGSTMMLTCSNQGSSCPDRSIARYYRYNAYGVPQAYAADGSLMPSDTPLSGNYLPEILYTGQRWDGHAQLHYYGARFYDPKLATFLTLDPVQEYMNPYAYAQWNPINRLDPTGAQDCDFDVCFSVSGGFPSVNPFAGVGYTFDPWFGANDPFNENFRLAGGLFEGGYYGFAREANAQGAGLASASQGGEAVTLSDVQSLYANVTAEPGLQAGDRSLVMIVGERLRGGQVRGLIAKYGGNIAAAARGFSVDADLIRGIIYEEQTHLIPVVESGLAERIGIGRTVGLGQVTEGLHGFTRAQLLDPATNIRAIATHLSYLQGQPLVVSLAPLASLATSYNCSSCTAITAYGRRVVFYRSQF